MKLQYLWIAMMAIGGMTACETAMPEYNDTECGLRILNAGNALSYTFLYDEPGTTEREVNISVQSVGFVKDYDRAFRIRQIEIDTVGNDRVNAVSGVHYKPIDEKLCIIPAGEAIATLPVVLLNDPSLEEQDVILRLQLLDNNEFNINIPDSSWRDIRISNTVVKPANWDKFEYYFGKYGIEKHRFLIQSTGQRWDEEFIDAFDYNMYRYYIQKAWADLAEENARREEAGEGPLTEKDGTVVSYPVW